MLTPELRGSWNQTSVALRQYWPRLTAEDVLRIAGNREALTLMLRTLYGKTFGELDREVTEFDLREDRAANMARPSLGITND